MNSSPHSWVKAQLSKAGRSGPPCPPSIGPLHVTIYWAPGQSRLLTLPHQEVCKDWGGQRDLQRVVNWVKDGPLVMSWVRVQCLELDLGQVWDRPWTGIASRTWVISYEKRVKISALIVRLLGDNVLG